MLYQHKNFQSIHTNHLTSRQLFRLVERKNIDHQKFLTEKESPKTDLQEEKRAAREQGINDLEQFIERNSDYLTEKQLTDLKNSISDFRDKLSFTATQEQQASSLQSLARAKEKISTIIAAAKRREEAQRQVKELRYANELDQKNLGSEIQAGPTTAQYSPDRIARENMFGSPRSPIEKQRDEGITAASAQVEGGPKGMTSAKIQQPKRKGIWGKIKGIFGR